MRKERLEGGGPGRRRRPVCEHVEWQEDYVSLSATVSDEAQASGP